MGWDCVAHWLPKLAELRPGLNLGGSQTEYWVTGLAASANIRVEMRDLIFNNVCIPIKTDLHVAKFYSGAFLDEILLEYLVKMGGP